MTAHLPSLALAFAACVAMLAALNVVAVPPEGLWAFDGLLALPTLLSASALLAAALGALALSRPDRWPNGAATWRLTAVLLTAFGLDQLGSLHERATERLDAANVALAAPPLVLAVAIGALAARSRAWLLAAGAAILAAALYIDLVTSGPGEDIVGALELAGAAMALLGVLAALQRREGWQPTRERLDVFRVGRDVVALAEPASVVRGLAALIAALALAGVAVNVGGLSVYSFDMNGERTVPAFASGAILVAAGLLAFLLSRLDEPAVRRWWVALGWCFVMLAADEVAAVHELLQDETGVKGQVFLAPLVAVAAVAWLMALRRLRHVPDAWALLVGGAVAWAVAQALDVFQTGPPRDHATLVPEEVLEMAGSGMFVLALLLGARRLLPSHPAEHDASGAPSRTLATAAD